MTRTRTTTRTSTQLLVAIVLGFSGTTCCMAAAFTVHDRQPMGIVDIQYHHRHRDGGACQRQEPGMALLANKQREPHQDDNTETSPLDTLVAVSKAAADVAIPMAQNAFKALRWVAATTLTESLPEQDRNELLKRMGVQPQPLLSIKSNSQTNKDNDNNDVMMMDRNSIQENIAAAVAKEARKNEQQWLSEREQIVQQAEQAARERVESDLAIQKQRLFLELEQQKLREQELAQKQVASNAASRQELEAMKEALQEKEQQVATAQKEMKELKRRAAAMAQKELLDLKQLAATSRQEINVEATASNRSSSDPITREMFQRRLLVARLQMEERHRQQTSTMDKSSVQPKWFTAAEYNALSDEEKAQLQTLREQSGPSEPSPRRRADVHPVLGPVMEDLGYKRIHFMSAGKLGTIPIWKKQRIFRHDRVKSMAADKWKSSMNLGIPGVICLHEDSDGRLSIIDGQHRVGMMMLLRDKQRKQQAVVGGAAPQQAIDFDNILVEVFPQQDHGESHAQDLFLEINKSEPIKLVDLPGVASAKDRNVINKAVERLYDQYPDMFSPSQRCRVPNVNIDNLRNSLFGSNVMNKHNLTTGEKLFDWMLEQNGLLGEKYETSEEQQHTVSSKAWKKASFSRFYLGLESSWLYN